MLQRDPVDNPAELAMGEPSHQPDQRSSRLFGIVLTGYGDLPLGKTGHDTDARGDRMNRDDRQGTWPELLRRVKQQWGKLRGLDRVIRGEAHIR